MRLRLTLDANFDYPPKLKARSTALRATIDKLNADWKNLEGMAAGLRDSELAYDADTARLGEDLRRSKFDLLTREVFVRREYADFLGAVDHARNEAATAARAAHERAVPDLWLGLKRLGYQQLPEEAVQQVDNKTIRANPHVRAARELLESLEADWGRDFRLGNAESLKAVESQLAEARERAAAAIGA